MANTEASKFKKADKPTEAPKAEEASKEDEEEVNEEGVDAETIAMVMDHCKCSRAKAVKALKNNNNDSVNAILEIEGSWFFSINYNLLWTLTAQNTTK